MKRVIDKFYAVVMVLCKLLLIAETVIVTVVVIGRYIFNSVPTWSEEIVLTCMVYMALISAAMAIRRDAHIRMTALDKYLPVTLVKVLNLLADLAVCAFAVIMIVEGWKLATGTRAYYYSIPNLSRFWLFFPVPVAGGCMLVFEIEKIIEHVTAFTRRGEGGLE